MDPAKHLLPSIQIVLLRFAPSKFASIIFAEVKFASIKFAFLKLAPIRVDPWKFAFVKFELEKLDNSSKFDQISIKIWWKLDHKSIRIRSRSVRNWTRVASGKTSQIPHVHQRWAGRGFSWTSGRGVRATTRTPRPCHTHRRFHRGEID